MPTLMGESAHAAPEDILEALPDEVARRAVAGAIYEERWHMAFWQQLSLEWRELEPGFEFAP